MQRSILRSTLLLSLTLLLPQLGYGISLIDKEYSSLTFTGYLRTGIGTSGDGSTQAHFIIPEAGSKYRLGNEADHDLGITLQYHQAVGKARNKSFDIVWGSEAYRLFGADQTIDLTPITELYMSLNNFMGGGESLWFGSRKYDRQGIDMLDRNWLNPGQGGYGIGIEHLLPQHKEGINEDIKVALFLFEEQNQLHYEKLEADALLTNYTADVRWTDRRVGGNNYLSAALNYTLRPSNDRFGYPTRHGVGVSVWIESLAGLTTNRAAIVYRQGANVVANHSSGHSIHENHFNDRRIISDLKGADYLEINNNFQYDDKESYAIDAVAMLVYQDFGTNPYTLMPDGSRIYFEGVGKEFYWLSLGARNIFYFGRYFRLNVELSSEYAIIQHARADGFLNKITLVPEFSLAKGIGASPVLRPFITYATWSKSLQGLIGVAPLGAGYGTQTQGFTLGLQFEFSW